MTKLGAVKTENDCRVSCQVGCPAKVVRDVSAAGGLQRASEFSHGLSL
jgi:hypothetical protein